MEQIKSSKILLAIDLALCLLWLAALDYNYHFKVMLWFFPLVRIWLSFLLYRKSRMAIYPIGILIVLHVVALMFSDGGGAISCLYLDPIIRLEKGFCLLFGMPSDCLDASVAEGASAELMRAFGMFFVMMCLPLVMYGYYMLRKQLVPSGVSVLKGLELTAYLICIMVYLEFIQSFILTGWVNLLVVVVFLSLIPVLFFEGKVDGLLTRYECLFLMLMPVLALGYLCGLYMDYLAPLFLLILPVVFYGLVNWYCRQKLSYVGVATLIGSFLFWMAQYLTGFERVVMLVIQVLGVLALSLLFIKATHRKMMGIGLFLGLAFVIPILCIGYNPYSVLQASRERVCKDYIYSPGGLLYVEGEQGRGIRDRYEMILPAEYDRIEILVPTKPYFKVKKGRLWYIYDLIAHELVTEEGFGDVVPYGKDAFLLKKKDGYKYMALPFVNREKVPVVIEDMDSLPNMELFN